MAVTAVLAGGCDDAIGQRSRYGYGLAPAEIPNDDFVVAIATRRALPIDAQRHGIDYTRVAEV
jgi:hypothetical protein